MMKHTASLPISDWDATLTTDLMHFGVLCRNILSDNCNMLPHRHVGLELLYWRKGEGTFYHNGIRFRGKPGRVLLFRSEATHHARVEQYYDRWSVCFLPDRLAGLLDMPLDLASSPLARLPLRVNSYTLDTEGRRWIDRLLPDLRELSQRVARSSGKTAGRLLSLRMLELFVLLDQVHPDALIDRPLRYERGSVESDAPLDELLGWIDAHLDSPITDALLANRIYYSTSQLHRLFVKAFGRSPLAYIRDRRIERAKQLLVHTDHTAAEISEFVGFADPSHFSRTFRREVGLTPGTYRARRDDRSTATA